MFSHSTDVLLQVFDWNTATNDEGVFYQKLLSQVEKIKAAGFTTVWMPPPWREVLPQWGKDTAKNKVGYFWVDFNKDSAYGTDAELKLVAQAFKTAGIKVIYDLVINHRDTWHASKEQGVESPWCHINTEEQKANFYHKQKAQELDRFCNGDNDLDLNENGPVFAAFVNEIVNLIQNYGADGFRFDFAKGYSPDTVRLLMEKAQAKLPVEQRQPLFLVAEHWSADHTDVANIPEHWRAQNQLFRWSQSSTSRVFDFPLQNEFHQHNFHNQGLAKGLNANPLADWRQRAVTFVENHDTGLSEELPDKVYHDYSPKNPVDPALRKGALAYILLSPGIPCVFWPHWHAWGKDFGLQELINDLIKVRKALGINAASEISFAGDVSTQGVLVKIKGSTGDEISLGIGVGIEHHFKFTGGVTYFAEQCGFIHFHHPAHAKKIMKDCPSFRPLQREKSLSRTNLFSPRQSPSNASRHEQKISGLSSTY